MFCHCCIRSSSPCISLAFTLVSRPSALGHFAKTPKQPLNPNTRLLVVTRLFRHGRSVVHPPPRQPLKPRFLLTPPFALFILSCFIYSSRSTVPSPFCCPSLEIAMSGRGPPGYLALSLCTLFDIDVLSFAHTLIWLAIESLVALARGGGGEGWF